MKISREVRRALGRYPYLEEYLSMGVINNRALARTIQDYIRDEEQTVNLQSIVSAIRRFHAGQAKPGQRKQLKILARSEVNLRYDVGTATMMIDEEVLRRIEAVHKALKGKRYMVLQGMETLTIVAEERDLLSLGVTADLEVNVKKNLATVVVTSPEEIVATSGVIAHLATLLAMEDINVVEMMSSHTETSFIIAEEDALRAVEVIRKEIKRARGFKA